MNNVGNSIYLDDLAKSGMCQTVCFPLDHLADTETLLRDSK